MRILNQICWIMFIYHRFTEPLSCIWVLFLSFSLQGEICLRRKLKFLLLQGAATYWVLQWNHNCWQYCEESLPMHYFPSIKMCYQLKHLRKMGVLCRYNKILRKILTPPWNFSEHFCCDCCIQWWHRTVPGAQKFMVLCSLCEEPHSFSQYLQGFFFCPDGFGVEGLPCFLPAVICFSRWCLTSESTKFFVISFQKARWSGVVMQYKHLHILPHPHMILCTFWNFACVIIYLHTCRDLVNGVLSS